MRTLEELRSSESKNSTNRIRRYLFADIRLKLGSIGLAGLIWAMSFLAAGTTIRTVTVPIEFRVIVDRFIPGSIRIEIKTNKLPVVPSK